MHYYMGRGNYAARCNHPTALILHAQCAHYSGKINVCIICGWGIVCDVIQHIVIGK